MYRTKEAWTALAPAKLNLFFEVYGKRDDGFHEIASLALPIRLFDTLTLQARNDGKIEFECSIRSAGGNDIPLGNDNLVVQALELLQKKTQTDQGANVTLVKRIPSQAGLGGGSSDASAAILAATKAWNLKLSDRELSDLGAQIGSDCPIFFQNGASLSRGRGERIQAVNGFPQLYFVLLKPPEGLSTAKVYANCLPSHDGKIREVDNFITRLGRSSVGELGSRFFNRLESAARSVWPEFDDVRRQLTRLDCLAVRMSGSGTAFFGLCRSKKHADRVAARLRQRVPCNTEIFSVASF